MRFSSRNGTREPAGGRGHARLLIAMAALAWLGIGCGSSPAGKGSNVLTATEPANAGSKPGVPVAAARTGAEGETASAGSAPGSNAGAAGTTAMAMPMAGPTGTPAMTGAGTAAGAGAASGAPAADAGTTPDPGPASPKLPPVAGVDVVGPFQTTQNLSGGRSGRSGLFHPTDLGKDGLKHPIFVWGCGGGAQPTTYAAQLTRIASHGIVVVAEVSMIGDNGDVLRASLDWIIAENERADSPFHGKLDVTKIAAGGHSIGSVNAFMMADDPRLTTSIHVAGGSLDDVYDINAPTTGMGGMRLIHPAAYICSQSDTFGNVEKTEQDYAKTTVPVFFTVMTGVDHVGAAREGLSAMVAWLRWHLGGESDRKAAFLDPAGEFCTGRYVSRNKNW